MTATVADVVEFEAWPVEHQELARRVLWATRPAATRSDVEDIRSGLREVESSLESVRRSFRALEEKIK